MLKEIKLCQELPEVQTTVNGPIKKRFTIQKWPEKSREKMQIKNLAFWNKFKNSSEQKIFKNDRHGKNIL